MLSWIVANWQGIIIGLVGLDLALLRLSQTLATLFPNVAFFGKVSAFLNGVDQELTSVESAVGIKQPPSS
jgi:hypothetical protein